MLTLTSYQDRETIHELFVDMARKQTPQQKKGVQAKNQIQIIDICHLAGKRKSFPEFHG